MRDPNTLLCCSHRHSLVTWADEWQRLLTWMCFSYSERASGQSGHEPVLHLHHTGHVHVAAARRVNDVHDLGFPVRRRLRERAWDTVQHQSGVRQLVSDSQRDASENSRRRNSLYIMINDQCMSAQISSQDPECCHTSITDSFFFSVVIYVRVN